MNLLLTFPQRLLSVQDILTQNREANDRFELRCAELTDFIEMQVSLRVIIPRNFKCELGRLSFDFCMRLL